MILLKTYTSVRNDFIGFCYINVSYTYWFEECKLFKMFKWDSEAQWLIENTKVYKELANSVG